MPRALKLLKDKLPKANYKRQFSQPARIAAANILGGYPTVEASSNPDTPQYSKPLKDVPVHHRPISSSRVGSNIVRGNNPT